jgi:hypothetical protein
MDPMTAAIIASALGGLFGGLGQGSTAKGDRESNERIANARIALDRMLGFGALNLGKGQFANQLRTQQESLPVRDQALFNIQKRLGHAPREAKPYDMFNSAGPATPQDAQKGGIDQDAYAREMATYTPGAGGTDPELLARILAKTGFGKPKDPTVPPPSRFGPGANDRSGGQYGGYGGGDDEVVNRDTLSDRYKRYN